MSIKLSHSGIECYSVCPRKYFLQYKERLSPVAKSSALYQGVAFDAAFNDILENFGKKSNEELIKIGMAAFEKNWIGQEDRNFGYINLVHNPDIIYTKKDFEEAILTEEDSERIEGFFQDLRTPPIEVDVDYPFETGYELFQHLRGLHRNFEHFTKQDKSFYNYVNWLSVKRKAPYFIKAYVENLLPYIEKVVSVQDILSTKDGDGNELTGIADMVLQLKPGTYGGVEVKAEENIISDNKTSSKLYAKDTVELSSQLSKYKHILNERGMNITKGAYFVIVKELKQIKNKTCKSCGYQTISTAKTCDQKVNKKRCGGEWSTEISFEAQTQIVVDEISLETEIKAMEQVDFVVEQIKAENFEPDITKCDWQFGSPCSYRSFCHNGGDMTGLLKVEKKK